MGENIIFIDGASFPKTEEKMAEETEYSNKFIAILEKKGHHITRVGSPWRGFRLKHIQAAFQSTPDAHTVIVNVHGNIKNNKHYLAARHKKSSYMFAEQFYKSLARFSGKRALNIFMFSCGSGNGCFDAIKILPMRSTLVDLVKEGDISSECPNHKFLDVPGDAQKPLAEHLFLSMLSQGYDQNTRIYPTLSVSSSKPSDADVTALWDMVRDHTLKGETFEPISEINIIDHLSDYFPQDTLTKAFRTIEWYTKVKLLSFRGHKSPDTSITLRSNIDEKDFIRQAREEGIFGAMCAIAYYANHDLIGAFQAGQNFDRTTPAKQAHQTEIYTL